MWLQRNHWSTTRLTTLVEVGWGQWVWLEVVQGWISAVTRPQSCPPSDTPQTPPAPVQSQAAVPYVLPMRNTAQQCRYSCRDTYISFTMSVYKVIMITLFVPDYFDNRIQFKETCFEHLQFTSQAWTHPLNTATPCSRYRLTSDWLELCWPIRSQQPHPPQ